MVLHVIGYHMQHIDNASTSVDTNNFTEIFNYVLKNPLSYPLKWQVSLLSYQHDSPPVYPPRPRKRI